MNATMIRVKMRPEHAADLEATVTHFFAALQDIRPRGIRYASCRLPDGATYVILLEVEEGFENPLPALAEFQAFQAALRRWIAEPPVTEMLTVVGSYRLF